MLNELVLFLHGSYIVASMILTERNLTLERGYCNGKRLCGSQRMLKVHGEVVPSLDPSKLHHVLLISPLAELKIFD